MKFLLTTPPFDLFKEGYGSKKNIKKGHMPWLGMGYIAAATEAAGIETYIMDPSAAGYDFDMAADRIIQKEPDVIGITSLTATESQASRLADVIKTKKDIPIIMGGPHATCYAEEIIRGTKSIDYVVLGEGEKTIVPLLERIMQAKEPHDIKGVVFRSGETIVNNGKSEIAHNLDAILPPARHLYQNSMYAPLPYSYRKLPATGMVTSRGCPYSKCAFCFSAGKMKERYRRHSPARIVEEIKFLIKDFGIREILFYDDNFLFNKKWIQEFCERMIKEKVNMSWSCAGRVDSVDFEMLQYVKSAGCWTVFYGIESGVQRLLDIIKKGITLEQVRNAVNWSHKAGLETRGSFMLALPGENPEDGIQTADFAVSLDLDYAQFHSTFPDPGTELFDVAKKCGQIKPYRGMSKATYIPDGYRDELEVQELVDKAYRRFYYRPQYVLKRIRSIRNMFDVIRYVEGFLFLKGLQ